MSQANPDCSFCSRTQLAPGKFVAGPDRWICDTCVDDCTLVLLALSSEVDAPFQINLSDSAWCEFCSKESKHVWRLLVRNAISICSECIEICNQILGDSAEANKLNILQVAKLRKLNNPFAHVECVTVTRGDWYIIVRSRFLRKVLDRIRWFGSRVLKHLALY